MPTAHYRHKYLGRMGLQTVIVGTATSRRDMVLEGLDLGQVTGIEIGPLNPPHVTKAEGRIIYVDHLTTAELRQKYASEPTIDAAKIVEVDAVWGAKILSDAAGVKANYIIASHVIEHVPDLIGWLGELHETLIAQGEVRLIVPDRRFTFDYLRHESTFGEAIAANMLKARAPLIHPILDHFLHFREVNPEQYLLNPELSRP